MSEFVKFLKNILFNCLYFLEKGTSEDITCAWYQKIKWKIEHVEEGNAQHSHGHDLLSSPNMFRDKLLFSLFGVKCLTRSSKLKETIRRAQDMVEYYENLYRHVWEGLKKTAKWKAEGHAVCRRGITDILKFNDLMFKMAFPRYLQLTKK